MLRITAAEKKADSIVNFTFVSWHPLSHFIFTFFLFFGWILYFFVWMMRIILAFLREFCLIHIIICGFHVAVDVECSASWEWIQSERATSIQLCARRARVTLTSRCAFLFTFRAREWMIFAFFALNYNIPLFLLCFIGAHVCYPYGRVLID